MSETPKEVWKTLKPEQRQAMFVVGFGAFFVAAGISMLLGWGGFFIVAGLFIMIVGVCI